MWVESIGIFVEVEAMLPSGWDMALPVRSLLILFHPGPPLGTFQYRFSPLTHLYFQKYDVVNFGNNYDLSG